MNTNSRHAYLIMAHNNFELLAALISALDDARNDIYIHVDVKAGEYDRQPLIEAAEFSNVYFTEKRFDVTWGAYNQIECELYLYEYALAHGDYRYLHFLSGIDFPLKTQDEIHAFFEANDGKEFVHFSAPEFNEEIIRRYRVYHPFQSRLGKKENLLYQLERCIVKAQLVLKFPQRDRNSKEFPTFCGGAFWNSITADFARYLIEKRPAIRKYFDYTVCADEIYIQTVLYNSPFYKNAYVPEFTRNQRGCQRYTDFTRGKPYTFEIDDFDELMNCGFLFARKFGVDTPAQRELVEKLYPLVVNPAKEKRVSI